jgi:hypothetical protein
MINASLENTYNVIASKKNEKHYISNITKFMKFITTKHNITKSTYFLRKIYNETKVSSAPHNSFLLGSALLETEHTQQNNVML